MSARFNFRSVPCVVTLAAVLAAGSALSHALVLKARNDALRNNLLIASGKAPASQTLSDELSVSLGTESSQLQRWQAEIAYEQVTLSTAEARVNTLCAKLGIGPGDEIKSLGRIDKLAADGIQFIAILAKLNDTKGVPVDERALKGLMPALVEWSAKSDAISRLESDSRKIAKLHTAALKNALKIDESTANAVQSALQGEFEQLSGRKLTRPHRPVNEQAEWYLTRQAALAEAAQRIDALIPVSNRKPHVVEQVLHLGTGWRVTTHVDEERKRSWANMSYSFPGMKPYRF